MRRMSYTAAFIFVFMATLVMAQDKPIEAGDVNWGRNMQAAFDKSGESGVPVMVLFQEIPGCLGCRKFGSEVLTHPLLVEAIENEFLPILVYNNRPGTEDEKWLKKYGEPSWNYQVIRFLNSKGEDILPRKDGVWTLPALAARMIKALELSGREVPMYLRGLQLEQDSGNHRQAAFAMACYWTGEYKLGKVDGVVTTEAGWYDNREVTLVTYHPRLITLAQLVEYAEKERCAQRLYLLPGDRVDRSRFTVKRLDFDQYRRAREDDQKKQLSLWPEVTAIQDLTPMQRTKLNSYAPDNRERAIGYLSPRQQDQLN